MVPRNTTVKRRQTTVLACCPLLYRFFLKEVIDGSDEELTDHNFTNSGLPLNLHPRSRGEGVRKQKEKTQMVGRERTLEHKLWQFVFYATCTTRRAFREHRGGLKEHEETGRTRCLAAHWRGNAVALEHLGFQAREPNKHRARLPTETVMLNMSCRSRCAMVKTQGWAGKLDAYRTTEPGVGLFPSSDVVG